MPAGRKYPVRRNAQRKRNGPRRRNAPRKRNAYRAPVKKATARMIQPIAEGRKASFLNDSSHIKIVGASEDDGWQVFIPETFNQMYREQFLETLDKSPTSTGFTGNTLFSRFITQNVKIKFDNVKHIAEPAGFQVVYGWSKIPYITATQSEGVTSTNANNVLIEHEPDDMIAKTLADMYNKMFPTTDRKMFKLMYNRRFQVGGYQVNTTRTPASQVRKDLNYRVKWAPNTKFHMRPATQGNGNDAMGNALKPDTGSVSYAGPGNVTGYDSYWTPSSKKNGDLWTPFFAIRLTNPDQFGVDKDGHADTNAYPILYQKNRHYFYDI